jgi:tellurite resistance protein TerC
MTVATIASLIASARDKRTGKTDAAAAAVAAEAPAGTESAAEAAAVVAEEKGTPPTVEQPHSDGR